MTMKNNSEILENLQQTLPVSFKVIGIGLETTGIIEKVKSFDYDCVGCLVVNDPVECVLSDEDKIAIIVAKDNVEAADVIAKTYHDAGVLTIGLVPEPDYSCFDSVATVTSPVDFSETVKNLLLPVVSHGYICFDFNDLRTNLKDSHSFRTLATNGRTVEDAVVSMREQLENVALKDIESLTAHLYFNREQRDKIKVGDIEHLSNMISSLPESIDVIWSVNSDDTLPEDLIKFTIIMSGKKL